MNALNKFWKFINGKKTVIAELYWFITGTVIFIWFPEGLTGTPLKVQLSLGAFLTFVGLGHKMMKRAVASKDD